MDPAPAASPPARPLLAAGLALALGSLAGASLPPAAAVAVALLALLAAAAAAARPGRASRVPALLLLAVAVARVEAIEGRLPPRRAPEVLAGLARAPEEAFEGRVRRRGSRWAWVEAGACGAVPPLLLETDGVLPPEGAVVAVLPGGTAVPWPRGPVPGPLAREGRFAGVLSLPADSLVVLAEPAAERTALWGLAAPFRRAIGGLRDRARARLAARAPADPALAGLERALVLGEREGLPRETADLFTRTGLRHLLAVSGLHVGLVAALLVLPAARGLARLVPAACGLARRPMGRAPSAALLGAGVLLLYAPLAGGAPPVARAALALALALLADRVPPAGRRPDGLSLWGLALALECLRDPLAAGSPGVRLSYGATLALVLGARRLAPRRSGPAGLAPGWPRALARRTARAASLALGASAVASLATLPELWASFGEASPWSVPLTPLALPALAGAVLGALWRALAPHDALAPAEGVLALSGRALLALAEAADRLPWTPVALPERPGWLLALAAAAILAALAGSPVGRRAAFLLHGVLLLPWTPAPAGLELHALAVGHGTAVAARAPGLPALVFDAGSRDRPFVLGEGLEPLLARWDPGAPVVGLSHSDRDHAGALPRLVQRRPPRLWLGELPPAARAALPRGTRVLDLERGRLELALGGPVAAALVRGAPLSTNEGSRSLELRMGPERVLLTGDAEGEGLAAELEAGLLRGPLRLLLFPHHGSHTPLLGRLLDRVRPAEVWISASGRPPVADELERRGLEWRVAERPLSLFLPAAGARPVQELRTRGNQSPQVR